MERKKLMDKMDIEFFGGGEAWRIERLIRVYLHLYSAIQAAWESEGESQSVITCGDEVVVEMNI